VEVDRCDVRQEVEALGVAEMQARLVQTGRVDDQRRLAVLDLRLDEPGDAFERAQDATPRIS
jgi:formate-dependent phosphoribosylglycinamide formyltransferase (GAR transformylase)